MTIETRRKLARYFIVHMIIYVCHYANARCRRHAILSRRDFSRKNYGESSQTIFNKLFSISLHVNTKHLNTGTKQMALSRIRKASGRWWGSIRRHQNQNDDNNCDDKCENEDTKLEASRFVDWSF